MQDAVKEAFASVGIDFVARNHGIKEKQSAPEIGLCASAIYGEDFDSITWDFGVDKEPWQRAFYAHRVALASSNRPALIHHGIIGKRHIPLVMEVLVALENMGMPVLTNDPGLESWQLKQLPDSLNITDDDMGKMLPPNLEFFRCGNGIEKNHNKKGGKNTGSGLCSRERFDRRCW